MSRPGASRPISSFSTTTTGGLYSQPTNLGSHRRGEFAVVPEIGVKLGYQLTDHVALTFGYSFVDLSNVLRPGDQIDRSINFVPPATGTTHPAFAFHGSDYWAQGINFGVAFRY